ncbi:MAG: aminotransferase class I/II-fold pyridoxal phosphate-dependent enzyme [Thermomicrobiales bacterium]|nr:aminotransferase class I/II-fold pyridoxal phosphate-dependent enzyme [Thermomicrobiales bacterium]
MNTMSHLASTALAEFHGLLDFMSTSRWSQRAGQPGISDFVLGNPHDGVLPGVTQALSRAVPPQSPDWHAYKIAVPASQAVVAQSIGDQTGVVFEPEDIVLTNGAFAGLSVTMRAAIEPGSEVIYISPPWFFYRALIQAAGAMPVRVDVNPETLEIDPAAIEAAITPRTQAVILNSPHNPTGTIASPSRLKDVASVLTRASAGRDKPIYLLSDEAYRRIVFDGGSAPSPAAFYPHTFLIYTYGKTLLIPGERLGYIAMPPGMHGREDLRDALVMSQMMTGWAMPNTLLHHSLAELESLSIDIDQLQRRRDLLVGGLRNAGFTATMPAATFYVLCRAPNDDDLAFTEQLAAEDVFVMPGSFFEMPGWVRFSLTANDAMVERALPVFRRVAGRSADLVLTP